MPKLVPVQESFSAGELSSRMIARSATKGYKDGAREIENMITVAQGPAIRRAGFVFAGELPEGTLNARVITFPVSKSQYFLLLFGPETLRILNAAGSPVSPEFVQNSLFDSGSANWTVTAASGSTVAFTASVCAMTSTATGLPRIHQLITGLTIGVEYTVQAVQIAPLKSFAVKVGTAANGTQQGQTIAATSVIEVVFTATATSHYVTVELLTPSTTATLASVSMVDPIAANVDMTTPYLEDDLPLLHYEISPNGKEMYVTSRKYAVHRFVYTAPNTFSFAAASFTSAPSVWTGTNHPITLTFFQGRLWFGGTDSTPSTFWGSKSGSFLDFTVGTAADDALAYTIAKRGEISWMSGGTKSLLIGTAVQEYVISSGDNTAGIITPTSIDITPQSAFGSATIQPALLGNTVVYTSEDQLKIRSMGYRFEESGWVSTELTFAANHILEQKAMLLAYAQNPESVIFYVLQDGSLVGVSYDQGNNIIGWHRHPSELHFLSIATVKFSGRDVIWATWRIERDGAPFVQYGAIAILLDTGRYLDAHKIVTEVDPTDVFTGFEHLAGLEVSVTADDAVHPNVTVSDLGEITLQLDATKCVAGLPIPAKLRTLPFEPGTTPQGSQASFKRFNKIYVKLLNSGRPMINGIRPPARSPATPMNEREPGESGNIFEVKTGWEQEEEITIYEDLPVELTVAAVFGEMAVELT